MISMCFRLILFHTIFYIAHFHFYYIHAIFLKKYLAFFIQIVKFPVHRQSVKSFTTFARRFRNERSQIVNNVL